MTLRPLYKEGSVMEREGNYFQIKKVISKEVPCPLPHPVAQGKRAALIILTMSKSKISRDYFFANELMEYSVNVSSIFQVSRGKSNSGHISQMWTGSKRSK